MDSTSLCLKSELVRVTVQCLPMASKFGRDFEVDASGKSVAELARFIGLNPVRLGNVQVNGRPLLQDELDTFILAGGELVNIISYPGDGDFGRLLGQIAIIGAASWLVGPAALGLTGMLAGAATGLIAGLLNRALIRPPKQPVYGTTGQANDPRVLTIGAAQNNMMQYGAVPVVFGTIRIYPPYAAVPYTELVGSDQYLRMMFLVGYGRVDISAVKIGETAIGDYDSVEYETLEGRPNETSTSFDKLYPFDVNAEVEVNTILTQAGGAVSRTTNTGIDEIIVNIAFPEGLVNIGLYTGARTTQTVAVLVEYQPAGGGAWTTATTLTVTDDSIHTVRSGYRWAVTNGQYNVRLTRQTADTSDDGIKDLCYWSTLQDVVQTDPVNLEEVSRIAVRIKATDQLSGIIDKLNCVAKAYQWVLQVQDTATIGWSYNAGVSQLWAVGATFWTDLGFAFGDWIQTSGFTNTANNMNYANTSGIDSGYIAAITSSGGVEKLTITDPRAGSTWHAVTESMATGKLVWHQELTNNPAWAYMGVLRGLAAKTPLADSRIAVDTVKTFADNCDTAGRAFNDYLTSHENKKSLIDDILSVGRASFGMEQAQYSVVEDADQGDSVAQIVTPLNSWNLESEYFFIPKVHALRCRFRNEDAGYQWDDRIVYNTGYDSSTATVIEDVTFRGITNPDQVWKMAIYQFAVATHRPSQLSVDMDFEFMTIDRRGSLILVNHDVVEKGLDSGRIVSAYDDGTYCRTITVDETFTMELGSSYAVQIRKTDMTIITHAINTVAGDNKTLTFTTPIVIGNPWPQAGDICMFGLASSVSGRFILKGIEPADNACARLIMVPEGPAIYTSDSGVIPAWTSSITREATTRQNFPPDPRPYHIRSDEYVLIRQARTNNLISRAVISLMPQKRDGVQADYYQVRYKRTGEVAWIKKDPVNAANNEVDVQDVEDGVEYDFEVRALTKEGLLSGWISSYTDYKGDTVSLLNHTIVGKSNNPQDVAFAGSIAAEGNLIRINWTKVSDLDVIGYEIRLKSSFAATWASASATAKKVGDVDTTTWPALAAGNWWFMIKAFDCNKTPLYSVTEDVAAFVVAAPGVPRDNGSHADANIVNLRWTDPTTTFPIKWCMVRRGNSTSATWATAHYIGSTNSMLKNVNEMSAGTRKYFILPYDIAGNSASAPAEIIITSSYPGAIAYEQEVNWSLDAVSGLSNCRPDGRATGELPPGMYSGSEWLHVPIDVTENWDDHFTNNSATSFQDMIDAGYEKFAEPGPSITDNGNGTSDCYVQWASILSGTGFDVPLVSGCKGKLEFEKIDDVGTISALPYMLLEGTDRDGDPYSQEVNGYELTVDSTFRFVDTVTLTVYFFRDNSARALARFRNFKLVIQHPEVSEAGTSAIDAAGSTVSLATPISVITSVVGNEQGATGKIFSSDTWSNDGVTVNYPATVKMYLKNGAGVGQAGTVAYHVKGY